MFICICCMCAFISLLSFYTSDITWESYLYFIIIKKYNISIIKKWKVRLFTASSKCIPCRALFVSSSRELPNTFPVYLIPLFRGKIISAKGRATQGSRCRCALPGAVNRSKRGSRYPRDAWSWITTSIKRWKIRRKRYLRFAIVLYHAPRIRALRTVNRRTYTCE